MNFSLEKVSRMDILRPPGGAAEYNLIVCFLRVFMEIASHRILGVLTSFGTLRICLIDFFAT